jgi:hypothetical protein
MTKQGNKRLVEINMHNSTAAERWLIYGTFGKSMKGYTYILLQEITYDKADEREKYLEFWQKLMGMTLFDVELILSGTNQDFEIKHGEQLISTIED